MYRVCNQKCSRLFLGFKWLPRSLLSPRLPPRPCGEVRIESGADLTGAPKMGGEKEALDLADLSAAAAAAGNLSATDAESHHLPLALPS
jgi:hypothetical protein